MSYKLCPFQLINLHKNKFFVNIQKSLKNDYLLIQNSNILIAFVVNVIF